MSKKTLNDTISELLTAKLQEYIKDNRSLSHSVCSEIYVTLFEAITAIFTDSNVNVSNEAANYIAQQYYDNVTVNNNMFLDPNIFTVRAKLENIATKELALLIMLFKNSDYAYDLIHELKRRS